ncbi:lipid A 3-O-deacylase [Dokdonella soli]|uniref:Lipid A 3-O-deacylase n=1 Tax=Dokdonella soli TaxID=529810 RepID=A0ABN1IEP7_9GAMM
MIRWPAFASRLPVTGIGVALLFAQPPAHADDGARWEVLAGRSRTLQTLWTNAAFVERLGDERAIGPFTWAPDFALGWIQSRSTSTARLGHDVGLLAFGARLHVWRGAFVSEQLALTFGRTDALSTAGEFVGSIGWQEPHWVLMLRHASNGDLHRPNHGETMLLLGIAF